MENDVYGCSVQYSQRWAKGEALIIAGDFNIQPADPTYTMIATGDIQPDHPQYVCSLRLYETYTHAGD